MKHVFGPVQSRRLGRSLGIDLLAKKICTLNCVYCEVGPTVLLTRERAEYVPCADILAEVEEFCRHDDGRAADIDVVTLTASGEPTLHAGFGFLLREIKQLVQRPVAVLTNSTTLPDPDVQAELMAADIVIPSLDAARWSSFRRVDRPAPGLDLEEIITSLVRFSRAYQGRLWLEILLVRGLNDFDEDIELLRQVISRMRIDRIQLNTVARPPAESFARPVTGERLQEIADRLAGEKNKIFVDLLANSSISTDNSEYGKKTPPADCGNHRLEDEIIQMLKRRPCTAAEIENCFVVRGLNGIEQLLESLVQKGVLKTQSHGNRIFYQHVAAG